MRELLNEFQWSLSATLKAAENRLPKGSYELKQAQMIHSTLRSEWYNLKEQIETILNDRK